jgi:hypothetical protein
MLKLVEKLERELNEANELNDHTWNQISIGKDFLVQRVIEPLGTNFFFFDVEEPFQGRALWTHPCRVNSGPVHRTLGSFPT